MMSRYNVAKDNTNNATNEKDGKYTLQGNKTRPKIINLPSLGFSYGSILPDKQKFVQKFK